jgi:hypothetical protein
MPWDRHKQALVADVHVVRSLFGAGLAWRR